MRKLCFVAAMLVVSAVGSADAGTATGTQAIVDVVGPTANNPDITLATTFTLGDLIMAGNGTGDFAANPISGATNRDFGSATLDLTNPGAFTFGSAAFGTFTASSITVLSTSTNPTREVSLYVVGNYSAGMVLVVAGFNGVPQPASLTISFNSTGGIGSAISDSATFATPPAPIGVPEPATLFGLVSGVAMFGLVKLRRKHV